MVHCEINTGQGETLYNLAGHFYAFRHRQQVFGAEFAQNEIDLTAARKIIANTKAKAGVLLCAQTLGYAAQTVMSGFATAGS